jgi:hypothetical protein
MAFNKRWLKIFKFLLPKANAFLIFIQKKLTQFLEGLTNVPDDFKKYINHIFLDIFPQSTRQLDLWKNQFGLIFFPPGENEQRETIDGEWKAQGGQGPDYIQQVLRDAGFEVYVHENNPPVDPDIFLNAIPIMVCGGFNAYAGRVDAFAGKTGGELLVNSPIYTNRTEIESVAGNVNMSCGNVLAVCRYFKRMILTEKIYTITDDPDYWSYFFFIGGLATRDVDHKLLTIENALIPSERENEFKRLILKLKPGQSWVGLIITYT